MASVTIELGSGKRATLTRASGSAGASLSAGQRSAVSELMLHWPKYAGLMTNAPTYLRQLGLDAHQDTPLDALRSAIEEGRVAVEIGRQIAGGGASSGQPSSRPFPLSSRLASVPAVASLPADKPLPSWATPSDVSADELISYLESVVGGAGSSLASSASGLVDGTPLGDAAPFSLDDSPLGDVLNVAAVDPFQEEQCFARYEIDMEMCAAAGAMYKDPRTYALCKQRAFDKYQTCRGM
ncbi:hypothetical protein WJ47_02550 [Burkholderia ubonensis]|uniref:Uncharacterized protein n=1 Tax=Burkholderia ubonensis TaxID=101571 RepID=A0AB73FSP2_9BURK|nr:hypothetical protein [Burkholderia ubonensis]KVK88693.1 hypothetical protein WJ44_29100 [Burkholderia ubonensis]KVL72669.1 hypothetical protein WJ47_02550 [Burkholderia ubonensis]KVM23298.1 hypothetical protein WJ53_17620 [Burkholderia ubonensis]KVM29595.1 hypothetical protein WJ54_11550 [Burkholderia ubonensis]